MISRKVRISLLITTMVVALLVMVFFVIKSFTISNNLNEKSADYEVKVQTIDDKNNQNLPLDIIKDAIDVQILNKSIIITLDKTNTNPIPLQMVYLVHFKQDLFQYLFLKLIISTFPQWKKNDFIFHFNVLKTVVWVQYDCSFKVNYIEWYFKIVSKI